MGFGVLGTVNGVGDFVSSAVVGVLWTAFGTSVAFRCHVGLRCDATRRHSPNVGLNINQNIKTNLHENLPSQTQNDALHRSPHPGS